METIICSYCGSLDWSVKEYGVPVHKKMCPYRKDRFHQGNPPGDILKGTMTLIRKNVKTGEEDRYTFENVTTIKGKNAVLDLLGGDLTVGAQIMEMGTAVSLAYSEGTIQTASAVARVTVRDYKRLVDKEGIFEGFADEVTPSQTIDLGEIAILGRNATTNSGTGELWAIIPVSPVVQKQYTIHALTMQYTWKYG